jgi:hypothetical protein
MGDFYGNFPDTSGAGKPPTAFTPFRSDLAPNPNPSAALFSQLMSTGAEPSLPANASSSGPLSWQVAPPLQPDVAPEADNRPTRFLVGRSYDSSQGSPFTVRPAPSQASIDGSLSIDDAYREYLKRLNANQSQA